MLPAKTSRPGFLLITACVVAACPADGDGARQPADGRPASRAIERPAQPEWETRVEVIEPLAEALAFRAGGGLIALLAEAPLSTWKFSFDRPASPSGGRVRPEGLANEPWIGVPSDIVGVSAQGVPWYLEPQTGRITSEDIGANRRVITHLRTLGRARTGCVLGDSAIAFLDDARPRYVFIQSLGQPPAMDSLSFPAGIVDDRRVRWTDLRFGGSFHGPCVLWAPAMPSVAVVSGSSVHALGPFVEPLTDESRRSRMVRWITRAPPPAGALDATSFPGGVAVLYAGRSPRAGRLVDLYSVDGLHLETIVLARTALRIAGSRHRLFVLSHEGDSTMLASYLLPRTVRSSMPDHPGSLVVPPRPAADSVSASG